MDAKNPRDPYGSPHHREPSRWHHLWSYLILAAIALGDAANFKVAFALKYPQVSDLTINMLVGTATLAALISMAYAGREARQITAGDPSGHRSAVWLGIAFWAGLGLTAFAVRLTAPAPTATDGTVTAFGSATQDPVVHTWLDELPAATLFLFVYLACGLVAYLVEYHGYNPLRSKLIAARGRARRAERRATKSVAALARATDIHTRLDEDRAAWERRAAAVRTRLDALADEARAHARLEISRGLGMPSDTSGVLRKSA
jgi:hypothetical protein